VLSDSISSLTWCSISSCKAHFPGKQQVSLKYKIQAKIIESRLTIKVKIAALHSPLEQNLKENVVKGFCD
jgi:hypothetical protein